MISRIRFWAGLVCAMAAAVWWAVGITVVQPLTEPVVSAENNTYWLRDARWLALLAIVLAFVWSFRGDKRLSTMAAGALALGFAADILLDRFDDAFMTGRFDAVEASSVRWGVYLIVILVPGAWIRARFQPVRPGRRVSLLAAALGAGAAAMAAALESPTDSEWALPVSILLLGSILSVTALGCALDVGGDSTRTRVVAGIALLLVVALLAGGRMGDSETAYFAFIGLAAVIMSAVSMVVLLPNAGWPGAALLSAGVLVVAGLTLMLAVFASLILSPGGVLTWLAGNPAVNAADSDVSNALIGIVTGLAGGFALLAARSAASALTYRAVPEDARTPS